MGRDGDGKPELNAGLGAQVEQSSSLEVLQFGLVISGNELLILLFGLKQCSKSCVPAVTEVAVKDVIRGDRQLSGPNASVDSKTECGERVGPWRYFSSPKA